ncbi:MAG: exodeoxyribonuclease VII small subunit [Clostridia bacterium]|nr:exodeoxyribonuclease VII small subunit [Clostridia bacterium]
MKKSNASFESTLEKLEKIVERLESGEENLDDSIALYEEGVNISNYCKDMLENAKQRVEKVNLK